PARTCSTIRRRYSAGYGGRVFGIVLLLLLSSPTPSTKPGQLQATARRTYGCGVEVLQSSRRGAVDYAAVPELRGVNLEPYRKPPVAVVKINFIAPHQQ
ncbi:MAG: hypothetical protein ACLQAT_26380, partial [Candidatus Binataceae bacterium]